MIFPLKKIKFEDIEISCQNQPLEFAELQYRNCMQMPEFIEIAHHYNLRNNNMNISNAVDFQGFLMNLYKKICYRNVNKENVLLKSIAVNAFKQNIYNITRRDKYKINYEKLLEKYNFLKSISE